VRFSLSKTIAVSARSRGGVEEARRAAAADGHCVRAARLRAGDGQRTAMDGSAEASRIVFALGKEGIECDIIRRVGGRVDDCDRIAEAAGAEIPRRW